MEEQTAIIAGHLTLAPEQRQAFIDASADLVARARTYPGCLDFTISPDPLDPARVYMLEVWRSEEDLQGWRKVANDPEVDIEFNDDKILKYEIRRSGPPF